MKISNDVDKYLKIYIQNISIKDKIDINSVRIIAKYKSQGIGTVLSSSNPADEEYKKPDSIGSDVTCSYDPDDEDYKRGYVTLCLWEPVVDEDTMVFVNKKKFYAYLEKVCEERIQKEPQIKDQLEGYLNQIRKDLNIRAKGESIFHFLLIRIMKSIRRDM